MPVLSVAEIARLVDADESALRGPNEPFIRSVSAVGEARPDTLVFAQAESALATSLRSAAGVIVADASLRFSEAGSVAATDHRVLWTRNARLAFSRVAEHLQERREETEVHVTALVAATARLGERVRIGPGVVVGEHVEIGDDCTLDARVVVYAGTLLMARVAVQAGAVLGSAGFGYVRDPTTGEYVLFPQQGRLVIEQDVSIGANTTIDRGALGETRIGTGTKIDNLVHIAHNCMVGRNVVIAAQTGIAGSSVIGDNAVIAGQVGIADHVVIGEGVILGAKSGVPSNKQVRGVGQVFWGIPARPIGQYLRELARLRRGL